MGIQLTPIRRLTLVIGISLSFFIAEISVGFYTRSLALIADAFHYLNDLVGFLVALAALKISQRDKHPKSFSFGWQRAQIVGAFFNGVFLLSLGVSIFLQSIDRFVSVERVQNPKLILIIGCTGLALNILSVMFLHEHDHDNGHGSAEAQAADAEHDDVDRAQAIAVLEGRDPLPLRVLRPHIEHRHAQNLPNAKKERDLGMMGVLIHVMGDAINNVGVIIAALVIWLTHSSKRYYADPAASMAISFMILSSSFPLVQKAATILLETAPLGIDHDDVKFDLEKVPGVVSVHELHIWRLNQQKTLASAHIIVSNGDMSTFQEKAKIINECFHAYGIHSTTLQPELASFASGGDKNPPGVAVSGNDYAQQSSQSRVAEATDQIVERAVNTVRQETTCLMNCGSGCEDLTCCG